MSRTLRRGPCAARRLCCFFQHWSLVFFHSQPKFLSPVRLARASGQPSSGKDRDHSFLQHACIESFEYGHLPRTSHFPQAETFSVSVLKFLASIPGSAHSPVLSYSGNFFHSPCLLVKVPSLYSQHPPRARSLIK